MQSDLYTVSKLFTERLFRIPDYQRGYAWSEKQLKDYWSDLQQLDEGKSHYLGVLTLEDVPESKIQEWPNDLWIIEAKNFQPFYVVDGQQRLTTTIVLIQALIEVVGIDCSLNYTSISDIKRKFLWDSKDGSISRSYIFGYEKDNPSYEFLKTKIFCEPSESSSTPQDTIYTQNLSRAKSFFLEKLQGLDRNDYEIIYRKITQQFLFNIYAISKEVDVYVAFETMNNRGKPLSHLELLKNRLIYLSTKFEVDDNERVALRTTINESWKSIYHFLGKNKDNLLDDDVFLRNHFILYFGDKFFNTNENPRRASYILRRRYSVLYKDYLLEEHFTTRNIKNNASEQNEDMLSVSNVHKYSKSMMQSVKLWFEILNPADSEFTNEEKKYLDRLNRLGSEFIAPLIMAFYQNTTVVKDRIELLKVLEELLFFNSLIIYHHFMDVGPTDFIDFASLLSSKKETPKKILKDLRAKHDSYKGNKDILKQVEKNFRSRGFYNWSGIKFFLYEYEQYLKSQSKTNRDKIKWNEFIEEDSDHHTVEHIYPQRAMKSCWTELYGSFKSTERKLLKHTLGNLVPLSRSKNSSFQNKCFNDKKGTVDNKVGFRFGGYAENEIAIIDEWTAVEIRDRGLKLLDFMEERWSINLGGRQKKIRLLGLEFVDKVHS